jgi:polyisoprenoid-binding protein YceI
MNFTSRTFVSLLFGLMLMYACNNAPKGDKAKISDAEQTAEASGESFIVDTSASSVRFTGHGVGKNHPGTFQLSSGQVNLADNKVSGGEFIINIKSMDMQQKEAMFQEKLKPHLLSGDFFDAEKFETARFVITKVEPYKADNSDTSIIEGANFNVSGNFTLKDATKNITFPARIDLDQNTVRAKANFDIDRTQWQMNYGNDKTLGDKFISETVNIYLDIVAKK